MKSSLIPAFENLDSALSGLEEVVEQRLSSLNVVKEEEKKEEPQLDLSARNERDINRKVAFKLDQTISRLETLLSGEK